MNSMKPINAMVFNAAGQCKAQIVYCCLSRAAAAAQNFPDAQGTRFNFKGKANVLLSNDIAAPVINFALCAIQKMHLS